MSVRTYRAFVRDRSISYRAIGCLLTLSLPEFDVRGATVEQLRGMTADTASATTRALDELATAGYATRHSEGDREVWRSTDKAHQTATAQ